MTSTPILMRGEAANMKIPTHTQNHVEQLIKQSRMADAAKRVEPGDTRAFANLRMMTGASKAAIAASLKPK
jgi:hypothetical protein